MLGLIACLDDGLRLVGGSLQLSVDGTQMETTVNTSEPILEGSGVLVKIPRAMKIHGKS